MMKVRNSSERMIVESRFMWASILLLLITSLLLLRLWYVQIFQGDYYSDISRRNRVRRVEVSVPRGIIYDRHGDIVLGNRPFFDLVYIPQYVKDKDTTFRILSRLMNIPVARFERRLQSAMGRPRFLPISLKRNLNLHEVSIVENNKVFLPGIEVRVEARREYKPESTAHLLGYLREVNRSTLAKNKTEFSENPYLPGDLIGKQGLEARWEQELRGKRGYELIQVDAFGRKTKLMQESINDYRVRQITPGNDLELTLDLELQKTVKKVFSGKFGAVVVLDPRNGQILAAVSEPGFNPEMMQTGLSREEWRMLTNNPYKPFLDKTTGGEFPPGSIFKPLVAMAGLEEGVITPQSKIMCNGSFKLGNHNFFCHHRGGHGKVDLRTAMMKSCDVYFYQVGVELGADTIAKYAKEFGLGKKLGVNINLERPGLVPTTQWKLETHGQAWNAGDTPNVSIGQGYLLMTPVQMAGFYASLANGGQVWQPYMVRRVMSQVGENIQVHEPNLLGEVQSIKPTTFEYIRSILEDTVMDKEGTGVLAQVPGKKVAGKTGTVQVVALKKNRNQTDVSMRWKEHAIFAAFSPTEKAEIAVAVVSQNDSVGGGGKAAAPIAQKIIAKYWQLKKQRQQQQISGRGSSNAAGQ